MTAVNQVVDALYQVFTATGSRRWDGPKPRPAGATSNADDFTDRRKQ